LATPSSFTSSGVETGTGVAAKFKGVAGVMASPMLPPEIFRDVGPLESVEPTLADRPWLTTLCPSVLERLAAITLLADWPLPAACCRDKAGEGRAGVLFNEDIEACWLSFDGDVGLCIGDKAPGLAVVSRGDVIREEDDIVELGLGGAKCGDGEA
jgi:hypothetical protein